MAEHPLQFVNGHLVAEIDAERALIDTGSPVSVGYAESIAVADRDYPLHDSFLGTTIDAISELSETDVTCLVGMDILGNHSVGLDVAAGQLSIADAQAPDDDQDGAPASGTGCVLEARPFMGVPVIHASIEEQETQAFLDTGASLSYVHADLKPEADDWTCREDFYPGLGRFEVKTRPMIWGVGDRRLALASGILPEPLKALLEAGEAKAILGSELLVSTAVVLNMPCGFVSLCAGRP